MSLRGFWLSRWTETHTRQERRMMMKQLTVCARCASDVCSHAFVGFDSRWQASHARADVSVRVVFTSVGEGQRTLQNGKSCADLLTSELNAIADSVNLCVDCVCFDGELFVKSKCKRSKTFCFDARARSSESLQLKKSRSHSQHGFQTVE